MSDQSGAMVQDEIYWGGSNTYFARGHHDLAAFEREVRDYFGIDDDDEDVVFEAAHEHWRVIPCDDVDDSDGFDQCYECDKEGPDTFPVTVLR